jgi:hypothetical protein
VKSPNKLLGLPFPFTFVLSLVLVYALIFGRATLFVWNEKKEAAKNPALAIVPVPLPDTSISNAQGTTVSFFGYQFEVPWQVSIQKERESFAAFVISQSGQQGISFINPARTPGFVKMMKDDLGPQFGYLTLLYGGQATRSDYDFVRAVLNSSPSQLSIVMPRSNEVRAANLLLMKEAEINGAETGLYSFEFGRLRGFQRGDPARSKGVNIEAFDAENHKFKFVFGNKAGPNAGLTQGDINRVLQTLRPAITTQEH